MPDYYEIDFRQVHRSKSGDAIAAPRVPGKNRAQRSQLRYFG